MDCKSSMVKVEEQQTCRLCGNVSSAVTQLFSQEPFHDLPDKINFYLHLNVQNDDGLPGHCCKECIKTIASWHNFYTSCLETDRKLQVLRDNQAEVATKVEVKIEEDDEEGEDEMLWSDFNEEKEESQLVLSESTSKEPKTDLFGIKVIIKECKVGLSSYRCNRCDELYTNPEELFVHYKLHLQNRDYPCHFCGERFKFQYSFNRHMKDVHHKSDFNKYFCTLCPKVLKTERSLKRHVNVVHFSMKRYSCSVCQKRFSTHSSLLQHQTNHSGAKPFICKLCPEKFQYRRFLQGHMKLAHSTELENQFFCVICGKDFQFKAEILLHKKNAHPKQLPAPIQNECRFCSRFFEQKQDFLEHRKTCGNEEDFEIDRPEFVDVNDVKTEEVSVEQVQIT